MIYRAYGFTLDSAVAIHALTPVSSGTTTNCDIRIEIGAIPDWAMRASALPAKILPSSRGSIREEDSRFSLTEHGSGLFFQLRYGDGTRFLVDEHATRIWGEAGPGLTVEDVIVYLLGPVMGFALRRHGRTPLHASALAFHGHAIGLPGSAGAGKSTTAAALALRGWPVLCEDICGLEESEGKLHVHPGYPRVGLWPDSVGYLLFSPDALPLIVSGWEKRYLPLDGTRARFASDRLPLVALYLLAPRSDDSSAPTIEPMSQRETMLHLVQNTYMNWLLNKEQRAVEFDVIARLVSRVPCHKVMPSSDPERLSELAALVESHALRYSRLDPLEAASTTCSNV